MTNMPRTTNDAARWGDRLDALRAELQRLQLDGFIVPKADEHQGEYVALRSERLEWLTGFSGSAGKAIVMSGRAALFVDGRYTLQAADQVDTDLFELCHITDYPLTEWMAKHVRPGQRIAYDLWLHTPSQVAALKTACEKAGLELVALEANPIDTIWIDQPSPPISPATTHPETFAGKSSADKRGEIGRVLREQKVDSLVISAPDSIAWLFNIRGNDVPYTPFTLSFALLHSDGRADWFIAPEKLTPDLIGALGPQIHLHPTDKLGPLLDQLAGAGKSVQLDSATIPMWVFQRLQSGGAIVVSDSDPCQLLKAQKNPVELAGMRNAHIRDGKAVCRFLAWLSTNAANGTESEISICDYLEQMRAENELFKGLSFPTISGSGPNGAIVHYRVSQHSNRLLDQNSLLLVDSGAQYLDGTTDITRTIALGIPDAEMRENFTRVLQGHIALATAIFPAGTTGSQLDVLARMPLWQAGLDYDHGTGHGVGAHLSVHEGPQRISKMPNSVALLPGMIISNEPGYYKSGAYGIRIENLIAVRNIGRKTDTGKDMLGFETLTLAPIDRAAINTVMLSDAEIAWVNDYHQRVHTQIDPFLDAETSAWLDHATEPLR